MIMEAQTEVEAKYHRLAAEFAKVRSQASVLKKAVLDEQAKSSQLNEVIRKHEQTIRKHDQEMESLIFRNEQLTKRIYVLQQELQMNSKSKKGKQGNSSENVYHIDTSVLDEELQKKILENAQLLSSISDKDIEIANSREKIVWLDERVSDLEQSLTSKEKLHKDKLDKLIKEKEVLTSKCKELSNTKAKDNEEKIAACDNITWKNEAEKWKSECEVLRSKPTSNEQLTKYYESQISDILEAKALAQSETKSLSAENRALKSRLENFILEHTELQNNLEKSYEELVTTNENYKSQLDAMTEHLAAQNEKITQQCDEIQILKHKLSNKK